MGFYFAFLVYYTSWLWIPAIPGVALTIYNLVVLDVDTQWNIWYAVFVAIWATLLFEYWKRTQSTISHLWEMDSFTAVEKERESFKHDKSVDPLTGRLKKLNFVNTGVRRITVTLPTILFAVIAVVGVFTAYRLWYRATANFYY